MYASCRRGRPISAATVFGLAAPVPLECMRIWAWRLLELHVSAAVFEAPIRPEKPRRLGRDCQGIAGLKLYQRAHLAIKVCVPQHELLAAPIAEPLIAPVQTERASRLRGEAPLEARKLLQETGFQVQVGAPGAQKLHSFAEAPTILLHHVS